MPGHWEGDLIKGARNGSAVGTLVERTTRLVILARMDGTDARSAREGFTKKLRHVPALLRKTLTYDRGKEMAEHARLAERLNIRVFFADPYSPWQRGTNENTNGLLRQYLPKGTDLSGYTQRELNAIAHRRGPIRLNSHPRFLSGVSAATYAASLPVGSITAYASSGVCRSRLEWGLARLYQSKYCIIDCLASVTES